MKSRPRLFFCASPATDHYFVYLQTDTSTIRLIGAVERYDGAWANTKTPCTRNTRKRAARELLT